MAGRIWRRVGTVGTVALLALGLAACNRGTSSNATGGGGGGGGGSSGGNIAAVIKGLDNPFFQAMQQGIEEQSKAQGTTVTVQAATSITDTTGQADKLNAPAGQDFSCYLVNPISGTNLVQSLVQVSRKNKPIVNIDSPIDTNAAKAANVKLATYVGTNNVNAGQLAGEQMVKELSGSGQVALVGGIAGDVTSGARLDGFKKAVGGKLDIVQTVAADWDRQKALTAATDILRARPGLKGFFAANDDMGLGIVRAIQNAGKAGKVKVISVDGIRDALESVKQGQLTATVSQYPHSIGQMGKACKAAASGKQLPANVEAPVLLVTKDVADKAISSFPSRSAPSTTPSRRSPADERTAPGTGATGPRRQQRRCSMSDSNTAVRVSDSEPLTVRLRDVGFWADWAAVVGLVVLSIAFFIATPAFLTVGNVEAMLVAAAILVVLAVGQTFVIATAGIDLSVASTMTLGAVMLGWASVHGWNIAVACLLAVLASGVVGLANGLLVAKGRITDFIVTLGTLSAASGAALVISDGKPVQVPSTFLLKLASGTVGPFGYSVLVAAVMAVLAHVVLFRTRFGVHLLATGGDRESARAMGVSTDGVKIAVYTISGVLAGLAAILLVARVGAAEPAANTAFLLNSVAAVVLGGVSLFGGRGTIIGPVVGALLLTALVNGLTLLGVSQFYQPVAVGIVVVLAALLTRFQR